MQVKVLNQVWDLANDNSLINVLFERIDLILDEKKMHIMNMKIDGKEIYEDFREYLIEHLNEIENVDVTLVTLREMANEILVSTEAYLNRAIPELNLLVSEYYQGQNGDSWDKLSQLLEGLQWIHDMLNMLDHIEISGLEFGFIATLQANLNQYSQNLEDAIERKDTVLIADILNYEFQPVLRSLLKQLSQITKVVSKYVN